MSLVYIDEQLTIYAGCVLLFTATIGNGMNIIVFLTKRNYRTTPCTFYFLFGSIANLLYIIIVATGRILSIGYGIDPTGTSVIWCKIRNFLAYTLALMSVACSCAATIDQYLVTSRSVNLRRCSNIKWAHRITFLLIIISCLHGLPNIVFRDISFDIKTCKNTNAQYDIYIPIFFLVVLSIIPILVLIVFGGLTYRNIRLTRALANQHADRQMIRMTLIQIVFNVICVTPFGIYSAYTLITARTVVNKDPNRVSNEKFASSIFNLISYIYGAGTCYMFLFSSSRFRRAVKDRILWWRRQNEVIPIQ